MRTTIEIDDDLLAAVRDRADQEGRSVRAVVEEALRRLLTAPGEVVYRVDLPITAGQRPPRVDVDSNAALSASLDRLGSHGT